MNLTFSSLHQIDHNLGQILEIDIDSQSSDLIEYTERLINEITSSTNKRSFVFKSETTELRTAINKFLSNNYNEGSNINAERLLNTEIEAQKKINHLNVKIQKGSLFQAVIKDGNETIIIISKADHNQFLDEVDFSLKQGLPWEKRIFKAFLVTFENTSPTNIFVYDTTNRMAKYWWDDYLELKEKYTNSHNTKTSLDILDKKIFNPIKKEFPADHTILRNSAIGYFRNNSEFELDNFIEDLFSDYAPVDPTFPKETLITKTYELPEKWKFDARFEIQKEDINKRQVSRIPLTEKIELVLKDYIADLDDIVEAIKDSEGNKYIKIKSDIGYERFNKELNR